MDFGGSAAAAGKDSSRCELASAEIFELGSVELVELASAATLRWSVLLCVARAPDSEALTLASRFPGCRDGDVDPWDGSSVSEMTICWASSPPVPFALSACLRIRRSVGPFGTSDEFCALADCREATDEPFTRRISSPGLSLHRGAGMSAREGAGKGKGKGLGGRIFAPIHGGIYGTKGGEWAC